MISSDTRPHHRTDAISGGPIQVSRPWWKRLADQPDRMVMWFCIGLLVLLACWHVVARFVQ